MKNILFISVASGETQETKVLVDRPRVLVRDPGYSPKIKHERAIPYVIAWP